MMKEINLMGEEVANEGLELVRLLSGVRWKGRHYAPREDPYPFPGWFARQLVHHNRGRIVTPEVAPPQTVAEVEPVPRVTVHHTGGGWYELRREGEVLEKVQGKENAEERAEELG